LQRLAEELRTLEKWFSAEGVHHLGLDLVARVEQESHAHAESVVREKIAGRISA